MQFYKKMSLVGIASLAMTLGACGIIEDTQDSLEQKVSELEGAINSTLADAKRDANGLLEDASLRDSALSRLKDILPDSLAVSSVLEGGDSEDGYLTKISRLDSVLSRASRETDPIKGIQGCMRALPRNLNQMNSPSCYGPSLDYNPDNHPDNNGGGGTSPGNQNMLPGGDLGIWDANAQNGQACAAAKLNQLSRNASKYSDLATGSMAMMVCVAAFAGDTLPGPGETLDISNLLAQLESKAQFSLQGMNLSQAKVTNLEGSFKISLEGTYREQKFSVNATHSPTDKKGVISVVSGSDQIDQPLQPLQPNNDCMGGFSGSSWRVASLKYQRSTDGIAYRMISSAQSSQSEALDAITASGEVSTDCKTFAGDLNVVQSEAGVNGGSMGFGWQAGSGDGFLRVFNATTRSDVGTAWFGYSPHTSESIKDMLTIDRMICNWAGTGNDKNGQSDLLQMQKMERLNDREWTATESKINYAPTNSCSMGGVAQADVFPSITWDVSTHGLATKSEYDFVMPTGP